MGPDIHLTRASVDGWVVVDAGGLAWNSRSSSGGIGDKKQNTHKTDRDVMDEWCSIVAGGRVSAYSSAQSDIKSSK